ncbi:MAG TPA: neutral zinc metallopeptidase [Candidatus Polarisedimenticolia bacterium]|nr:neutral zinc metallopeptidase [Candidatus Polarisedimenticolia bacterium]
MRWIPGGRSRNLEDRRGESAVPRWGMRGMGGLGLGGFLVLLLLSVVFKTDFFSLLSEGGGAVDPASQREAGPINDLQEEPMVQFVSFVLDDVQEVWTRLFPEKGARYQDAQLVLFRNAVDSACGFAQSATGPFYCPGDRKVYIDLEFYKELRDRFGAPGDFAQAYVIAHEVGHHVQTLLGGGPRHRGGSGNEDSVRRELQADCYAGVWAHSTSRRDILESGDVEEALNAAAAIGDDRLQRMGGGMVNPDAFTHGSSRQRVAWFRRGLDSGRPESCDTFRE